MLALLFLGVVVALQAFTLYRQRSNHLEMKTMNANETAVVNALSASFNKYTTNVGEVLAKATQAIKDAQANGTESSEFLAALNAQVATIDNAAAHLSDFTVPTVAPGEPPPTIEPGTITIPPPPPPPVPNQ